MRKAAHPGRDESKTMTDLSEDGLPEWTGEELALLRSADDDRPPGRSLPATLTAAGVGGALASGAAAAKGASVAAGVGSATAKWTTFLAASKWVGVVMLGGTLVTGTVVLSRRAQQRERAEHRESSAVTTKAEPRGTSHEALIATPAPEPAASGAVDTESREGPPASSVNPSNLPGRRATPRSQPDISLEIAALDDARAALRGGRSSEALAALDRYGAEFGKNGSLRVEATVLRVDALLRSGQRDRATALADAFLTRNPKSPYAARLRALMADGAPR